MKTRDWVAALAAAAFCVLIDISGTFAQTGAPAAGPPAQAAPVVKKAKAKPPDQSQTTVDVTVVNSRAAGLLELEATESGFPTWKKIAGPLKAGQKAAARVPRGKDCKVDLHGAFADGQSLAAEGVEVCANRTLNLKD
jgi:hypothetical protein